jgi:ABC-type lipoprotein release transport system permease subunit
MSPERKLQELHLTLPPAPKAMGVYKPLVIVGVVTSTYPARRAALLPPVEALRFES